MTEPTAKTEAVRARQRLWLILMTGVRSVAIVISLSRQLWVRAIAA
jgi:hypothetical protein